MVGFQSISKFQALNLCEYFEYEGREGWMFPLMIFLPALVFSLSQKGLKSDLSKRLLAKVWSRQDWHNFLT